MWIKLLLQLRDLLPHLTHLIPLLERFLAQRQEQSHALGLDPALFNNLSGEVTESNAAILQQLRENTAGMALLATEMKAIRTFSDTSQKRITDVEDQVASIVTWLRATSIVTILLLIACLALFYFRR